MAISVRATGLLEMANYQMDDGRILMAAYGKSRTVTASGTHSEDKTVSGTTVYNKQ